MTGTTRRSGYALARSLDLLGLASGWARLLVPAVLALPLLTAAGGVAVAVGQRRVAAVLWAVAGATGILGALGVNSSPVAPDDGVWVALVAGAVTVVTALAGAMRRAR